MSKIEGSVLVNVAKPSAPEAERIPEVVAKQYRGLCSTCKNAEACSFPRDPNRPVLECDEFDGYEVPQQEASIELAAPGTDVRSEEVAEKAESNTVRGLCRNCGRFETCTYPKPEGGVWHCDEYE